MNQLFPATVNLPVKGQTVTVYLDPESLSYRLERAKRIGIDRWVASCPGHRDPSPSLTVSKGRKGTLMHCFAGCSITTICNALNISVQQLFFDATQHAGNHDASLLLAQMQATRRNNSALTLRSLGDVAEELWSDRLTPDSFLRAQLRWPDEVYKPFNETDPYLVTNGYLGDLWEDRIWDGTLNWFDMPTRHRMWDKMWKCWYDKGLRRVSHE